MLAYTTMQRTREIGIRIALGSTRLAISGLVLKEMLRVGAVGVLSEVHCSVSLFDAIHRQLFGYLRRTFPSLGRRMYAISLTLVLSAATLLPAPRRMSLQTDGSATSRIGKPHTTRAPSAARKFEIVQKLIRRQKQPTTKNRRSLSTRCRDTQSSRAVDYVDSLPVRFMSVSAWSQRRERFMSPNSCWLAAMWLFLLCMKHGN